MQCIREYPIEVDGLVTRVLHSGPAGKTQILFIHGVGARADRWRLNMGALAAVGIQSVAIDLPGHGFAQKGPWPYTVGNLARFVTEAAKRLELFDCSIVGTSLGGNIAGAAAANNADFWQRLFLVGSLGLAPLGAKTRLAVASRLVDTSYDGTKRKLALSLRNSTVLTDELIREEVLINSSPGSGDALSSLASYIQESLDGDLLVDRYRLNERFPRDVHLIWGELDHVVSVEVAQNFLDNGAASSLDIIEGAGHIPYMEVPHHFNQLLLRRIYS